MINSNLIPAERLARKRSSRRLRAWSAVAAAYLLALVGVWGGCYAVWGGDDHSSLAEEMAATEQQITDTSTTIENLKAQLAEAQAALETLETVGHQPDWSALLALLSQELGQDVVLQGCQLTPTTDSVDRRLEPGRSQSPATADKPLGQQTYKLGLTGFGRTQQAVSQFVLNLEGVEIFKEVRLVKSNRQPFLAGQAVAFRIQCLM